MIWANLKCFLLLYFRPTSAVSGFIDSGSWWLALAFFVATSFAFHFTVKERIFATYGTGPVVNSSLTNRLQPVPREEQASEADESENGVIIEDGFIFSAYPFSERGRTAFETFPVLGHQGRWLLAVIPASWFASMLAMVLLFVPASIFTLSLMEPIGSFGLLVRRDFGTVVTCILFAWSASHLPFALFGIFQDDKPLNGSWFLLIWVVATVWFAVLATVILRTVYGCSYGKAAVAVMAAGPAVAVGARLFGYFSSVLCSPLLLIYLWFIARNEMSSIGTSYRQRQNFRRYLESSTINPRDADAHYQLGLIHQQRRQEAEAEACFRRAIAIDSSEVDARFQLGRLARKRSQWQEAIDHFSVVVAENDQYAQGEIWREVGATYLGAGMIEEARAALEKYVERRAFDPEGLYYLGETLRKLGRVDEAASMFERCLEAVKTMPNFRYSEVRRWSKLAREQLAAVKA
ncbi:MAG: tetratricopeptide repeat protein [Pyrinomonadaceae bacterium]